MKTVFFDVDTQIDFLYPAGGLYVPDAEEIVGKVAALNRFAWAAGMVVISTADAHSEDDPEFREWPPHCIRGTVGQQKPQATVSVNPMVVRAKASTHHVSGAGQIIVEKVALNCFTNASLAGILDQLGADRYVVYGVVTEVCVRHAIEGLQQFGNRIELVEDAVMHLSVEGRDRTFEQLKTAGGVLTQVTAVCR